MAAQATKELNLSKGYRNYIFILLFLLYFFDYVDRMIVSSLFPFIKSDWGLTDAECGMLVSAVYWSIIIFTFPVSILVDRWSRKKTIGLMAVVWSVATGLCAFAGNFKHLFVSRTVIGIGEAGYAPGGTAMISGLYPEEKRSSIMGLWNASIPLGNAVGMILGGIIATHWGWRHAFGIVALPGLFVAILFFFVKDYKTVELVKSSDTSTGGGPKVKMKVDDIFNQFIRTPSLIFTYFGFAGMTFVLVGILTWLPSFFNRVYDIPMDKAGLKAGTIMALALIGAPIGGYLADRWLRTRTNARPLYSGISALIAGVLLLAAMVLFTGDIQYVLLLIFGVVYASFVPAAAAVTQDVVHPGLRATSYAICVVVQNLLGSSTAPIVIGSISDGYDIQTAMMILPAFLLVAAVLFFAGSIFYTRDLGRVEKIALEIE